MNDGAREQLFESVRDIHGQEWYDRVVNDKGILRYGLRADSIRYGDTSDIQGYLFECLVNALGIRS